MSTDRGVPSGMMATGQRRLVAALNEHCVGAAEDFHALLGAATVPASVAQAEAEAALVSIAATRLASHVDALLRLAEEVRLHRTVYDAAAVSAEMDALRARRRERLRVVDAALAALAVDLDRVVAASNRRVAV